MELRRKLYTRGSSYETTIPKPLLFSTDLKMKQVVKFLFDKEKKRWYIEFEEFKRPTPKPHNPSKHSNNSNNSNNSNLPSSKSVKGGSRGGVRGIVRGRAEGGIIVTKKGITKGITEGRKR